MIHALLSIAAVVALAYATGSFVPRGMTITGSGAALAFGFLLITAVHASHIFGRFRLPHLTGYLVCGLLFGPEVLGLVTSAMLDDLAVIKGTAIGLIAFLAGSELDLRALRPKLRLIGTVSALTVAAAGALLFALFYGITYILPVTAEFTLLQRFAVALVCANVLTAYSPAVVVGLISETRASGPLSEMTLSVVVLADLVIVVLYSVSSAIGHLIFRDFPGAGDISRFAPHIFGSIVAGMLAGAVLALYAVRVVARSGIFTLAVLFVAAEAGAALELNPLLIGLTAGVFLTNITPAGTRTVTAGLQPIAMPTVAIFFAVIGAELFLRAFLHVAPFAIAAAIVRAAGIFAGTWAASRVVGMDRELARRLPSGLLPQAGIAIALASLVLGDFRPWGQVVGTVLLGTIVVNEVIAPVLFRNAILAAGEGTADEPGEATDPSIA